MSDPPTSGKDDRRAKAEQADALALRLHVFYGGKVQTLPKCAIRGLEDSLVRASRDVVLGHEGVLSGDEDADAVVLPGGADGARRLGSDDRVLRLLQRFEREGRWIATSGSRLRYTGE